MGPKSKRLPLEPELRLACSTMGMWMRRSPAIATVNDWGPGARVVVVDASVVVGAVVVATEVVVDEVVEVSALERVELSVVDDVP